MLEVNVAQSLRSLKDLAYDPYLSDTGNAYVVEIYLAKTPSLLSSNASKDLGRLESPF
jgi:hypothetical protein